MASENTRGNRLARSLVHARRCLNPLAASLARSRRAQRSRSASAQVPQAVKIQPNIASDNTSQAGAVVPSIQITAPKTSNPTLPNIEP
jgi:hypothetical protein